MFLKFTIVSFVFFLLGTKEWEIGMLEVFKA